MISYNVLDTAAIVNYPPTGYNIDYYYPNRPTYRYSCSDFAEGPDIYSENNEVIYKLKIQIMPVDSSYCDGNGRSLPDDNIMNYEAVKIYVLFGGTPAIDITIRNVTRTPGFDVEKYILEIRIKVIYETNLTGDSPDQLIIEIETGLDAIHQRNRLDFINTKKYGIDLNINHERWVYHKRNKHTVSLSDVLFSEKHNYKFLNQQDRVFVKRIASNKGTPITGIAGFTNQNYYVNAVVFGGKQVVGNNYIEKLGWYETSLYALPFIHHRNGYDFYNKIWDKNNKLSSKKQVYSSGFWGQRSSNMNTQTSIDPMTGAPIFQKMVSLAPNVAFAFSANKNKISVYTYNDLRKENYRLQKQKGKILNIKEFLFDTSFYFFSLDYDKFVILSDSYRGMFITQNNNLLQLESIEDIFQKKMSGDSSALNYYNIIGHGGGYLLYYLFLKGPNNTTVNIMPWQKMILRRIDRLNNFYLPLSKGTL